MAMTKRMVDLGEMIKVVLPSNAAMLALGCSGATRIIHIQSTGVQVYDTNGKTKKGSLQTFANCGVLSDATGRYVDKALVRSDPT